MCVSEERGGVLEQVVLEAVCLRGCGPTAGERRCLRGERRCFKNKLSWRRCALEAAGPQGKGGVYSCLGRGWAKEALSLRAYRRRRVELEELDDVPGGRTIRGDWGHLMPMDRILPQSEVIRAIVVEYSPCCGVSRTGAAAPSAGTCSPARRSPPPPGGRRRESCHPR